MKKYLFILLAAASVAIVSCKPQPKPEKEVTFEISVSDVTAQEATVSVVPSDTSKVYYYGVIQSAYAAEYESMDALADSVMFYLKEEIDYYADYGYVIPFSYYLDKGNASYEFSGLTAETSYTAFAFVADTVNVKHVGKVAVKAFTTEEVPNVNLSFELAQSDTAIWFLPNNDEITYLPLIVDKDSLNGYTLFEYYVAYWEYMEMLASMYEMTLDDLAMNGPIYALYEGLEAGHQYYFVARAYTAGTWNSQYFETLFDVVAPNSASAKASKKFDINKKIRMKKAKKVEPMKGEFKTAKMAK